jgi:mono/diheme cytochrome c family protein
VYGDYVSSGVPLALFREVAGSSPLDLGRAGASKGVPYRFNIVKTAGGAELVAPNCLTCHAEQLDGRLVLGLGNNTDDHTVHAAVQATAAGLATLLKYGPDSAEVQGYRPIQRSQQAIGPLITTRVRGVNPADKIFAALAAHREAEDLSWLEQSQFDVPAETVPTDVPAWWLMKKKNALYYNGLGRGDFARLSSASGMLTMKDREEAARMDARFPDVLAWIRSLEPPRYPYPIDAALVSRGREVFAMECAQCHGTYGEKESYPNLLVSLDKVGTDPLLSRSYAMHPEYHSWYNRSWYGQGPHAGRLEPNDGYVAPPLDGVWATAPYLHNGSVPTLEDLLDSTRRPALWKRDFGNRDYDPEKVGWRYETPTEAGGRDTYDTTLPGYGNSGHEFGDSLSAADRKAVIEYLKTL